MTILRPGSVPASKMGSREWARFCRQKPVYEIASVDTTTFTATTEEVILVDDDTAGGVVTITLPPVSQSKGLEYLIKKMGTTANVVVDGDGSETIDGQTTQTISTQYNSLRIMSECSEWVLL